MPEVWTGRFEQFGKLKFHVAGMLKVWVKVGRLVPGPFQTTVHWTGTLWSAPVTQKLGLKILSI